MKNDPIQQFLDLAEDFLAAQKVTAQTVPDDVLADLRHRMFGDPLPPRKLRNKEANPLLLMLLSRRGSTANELLDALEQERIVFDQGEGTIFGLLQKLEKQAYVMAEWEMRGEHRQQVYKLTEDGRNLLKKSAAKTEALIPLADQIAARFASA